MSGILNFSVSWKAQLPDKTGDPETDSPSFWFRGQEWFLMFTKCGLYVYLSLISVKSKHDTFSFSVQVENSYSGLVLPELSQRKRVWSDTQQSGICIWSETIKNVKEADPNFSRDFQLTFRVTFEEKDLQPKCATDPSVQTSLSAYAISLESLSEDFAKLLDEDSNPDVELQCGDTTTRAHKNVLCSRSPVLAKMLQSDMVEGKTGEVTIQNMDADIFQQFLRYLYTGKVDDALTFDTALSLYEAGDMYDVKSLVRHCSKFLIDGLTVENACDALALADAHSDADFAEKITAFILEKEIPVNSDLWSSFCASHPILANTVLTRFCKTLVELRKS